MAEDKVTRKLTTILVADVEGYTRLMRADEEATLKTLGEYRDVIDGLIARHEGRVFSTGGDSVLAEFGSAVEAVRCAISCQEEISNRNAELADDRKFMFRIGINIGDVMVRDGDLFGDGVNVAARLEGLAEPGGICVSGTVYEHVAGKLDLRFDDLGEKRVKNIAKPVRVYHVELNIGIETTRAGESSTLEAVLQKPAVAVLPFTNMSGDPEQEYFSDGLAEDIITLLSAWRSFPVIARNSTFVYKGQSPDVRQVAKELAARYVIEGSVRKSGNRVRITAQLIDAQTGHHVWAEKFDGTLEDIFQIQDEITQRIVATVESEMEQAELKKSGTQRTSNLSAWDYYLRGMAHLHKMTQEGNVLARDMFEKAIELDPEYSDAFAQLSSTYTRDILLEVVENRELWLERAFRAARRAVELDSGSSFAHLSLSAPYIWANQHELSIPETRMAMQLNPSNVHACLALGNRLDIIGDDNGIPILEKSLQLNPRDPRNHVYYVQLARAYINSRQYDKALELLREAIRRKSDFPHAYHVQAICLGHLGRIKEARRAAQECERIHPGFIQKRANWNIYVDSAANQHLLDGLREAGILEQ